MCRYFIVLSLFSRSISPAPFHFFFLSPPLNPTLPKIIFRRTCGLFDSIEIGQFRTNRGPNFTGGGGVPCQDRKACLRCVLDRWQGQAGGYWGRGAPAGHSRTQPGHGAKTTCPGPSRRTVAHGTVMFRTVLLVQRNAPSEP